MTAASRSTFQSKMLDGTEVNGDDGVKKLILKDPERFAGAVSRYLRAVQRRGDPGKRWLAFLRNHREAIVAMDFSPCRL